MNSKRKIVLKSFVSYNNTLYTHPIVSITLHPVNLSFGHNTQSQPKLIDSMIDIEWIFYLRSIIIPCSSQREFISPDVLVANILSAITTDDGDVT